MTERREPSVVIAQSGGVSLVTVDGMIDEHFKVASFAALNNKVMPILFNLDGATRITSFGVREWMRALKSLRSEQYFFTKVRPPLVAQFNSIHQFGGKGLIVSLYCPYVCTSCEHSFDVLVDLLKQPEFVRAEDAPDTECPSCKSTAIFDDLKSMYFAHVGAQPPLHLPQAVLAALDGSGKASALRIHKAVEGDLTVLWLKGTLDKSARLKRHADGLEGKVLLVLDGCETRSADGVETLGEVIDESAADIYLALAPLSVLKGLVVLGVDKLYVLSATIPGSCSGCGNTSDIEVQRWGAVPPDEARKCPHCGQAKRSFAWTAEDASLLRALQPPPIPGVIEAYMHDNSDWQTHPGAVVRGAPKSELNIEPGTRIDKYEVIRRIGFGGMAEVLLGRQLGVEGFEKKVVIKRILPRLAAQPAFVNMFLSEARIAARLVHANIVQIYDLVHAGDEYYSILEYVRGADLNVLQRVCAEMGAPMPVDIACRIVCDVCAGLNAAHTYSDDSGAAQPIVHRDVTPHNILVSTEGAVKLTDFGIAKAANTVGDTDTGMLKGKVLYMAPEAILGKQVDARADVYAASVVLYQCLTGRNPFFRDGEVTSMRAVLEDPVPRPDTIRKDVPPSLVAIIERGMHRDRDARYQTADALQADLESFLARSGRTTSSTTVGVWAKELIAKGRNVNMPVPQNTPSHLHKPTDEDPTQMTPMLPPLKTDES